MSVKLKEAVGVLDNLSIRLLLVLAAVVVGFSISAAWANTFRSFFMGELTNGVPNTVLLVLPFATYILLQTQLDIFNFRLRRSMIIALQRSARKGLLRTKKKVTKFINQVSADAKQYLDSEEVKSLGIDRFENKLKRLESAERKEAEQSKKLEKHLKSISEEEKKWYAERAHLYITGLVFRFAFLSGLFWLYAQTHNGFSPVLVVQLFLFIVVTNKVLFYSFMDGADGLFYVFVKRLSIEWRLLDLWWAVWRLRRSIRK